MNIRLSVRVLNDVLKSADDSKTLVFEKSESFTCKDMLLTPMYALPGDIAYFFMDNWDPCCSAWRDHPYEKELWRILFEGSLEADSIVTPYVTSSYNLTTQTTFYVKRRYVIAYAMYYFSMIFYRDYLKAIKKSKFLSDLKISLDIEKDPDFIKQLTADAKSQMDAIKTGLNAPYNMQGFVKGAANPHNKTTARLWFPALGNNFPDISMATTKAGFHGKLYKIGDQFQHLYPNFYEKNAAGLYNQNYRYTNF